MKIIKSFLTNDVIDMIINIDKTFYEKVNDEKWYKERYNRFHYAYILMDEEKPVGYILSVPIRKQLYDAIKSGVLINDTDVNPNMIVNESYYNYITSCVILEEYRNKGYGKNLLETLLQNGRGFYIALTISNNGYKLARTYMDEMLKINNLMYVFEKEID